MDFIYFLFFPVTIGIGGWMLFLMTERWHQLHDRVFLSFLLCCMATIYITIRAVHEGTGDYTYLVLDNLETLIGLSICPLFFLYMRITTHDVKWHNWYWGLFAPAVILFFAGTILSISVGWDRILAVRQGDYAPFIPASDNWIEKIYLFVNITLFNIILEVMAIALLGLSIYYLAKYHKHASDYFANLEESSFDNMNRFLFFGILIFITIFLITFFISYIIHFDDNIYFGISTFLSVIIWIVVYNAYKIRISEQYIEVMSGLDVPADETNAGNDILGQKIDLWEGRKDKPFCKEGITLVELAKELGVSRQALSAYINTYKKKNFNLWINTLRVEETKKLILTAKELKIGYISDICGFGSQASFSKVFRRIVGMSPQDYRDAKGK